ncbi:MAG: membrane protein insertase YidC [Alphaproteobacteria bacterium]
MKSDKDNIHPDDLRNALLFFVSILAIYYLYNYMVVKPREEALMEAKKIEQQKDPVVIAAKPRPRAEVIAETPRITIDNGVIYGSIALKGGRIDDISFREFFQKLDKKDNVVLLSPKETDFVRYVEYGWVAGEGEKIAVPDADTLWSVEGNNTLAKEKPVRLVWNNGQGQRFERIFSIDENYLITVDQKVTNNAGKKITLHPYGLITQTGLPSYFEGVWISHEGAIGYIGDELVEKKYTKLWKEPEHNFEAKTGWTGITDKYWLTALLPPQGESLKYRVSRTGDLPGKQKKGEPPPQDMGKYQVDYTGNAIAIAPGQSGESTGRVFMGAKRVLMLQEYGQKFGIPKFDLAVDFGWFWFMTKPFFYALHYLYQIVGNMGVAIILLTVVIRSAVFPLTNASYKSFAKMQKVSPQVLELRKASGGDKKKLQEDLIKLYEREGVNPMAGCLPMLVQIPIFFSLYKALFVTIEMRHAPFFGWIKDLSAADPTNMFNLFGMINWDPPAFLHVGVWPLILMIMMYIQQRMNPPPQDPIQRDMAIYMPIMMTYIMSKFAAGLVVYWTFSALIGVIQQAIIKRSLGVPIYLFGPPKQQKKMEQELAEGPVVHPLIEMAEKDIEKSLLGGGDDETPGTSVSSPKPRRKKKK